ncbi:MAG: hypothetical protein MR579_08150 [Bacteroidales bacterium]|nr:hypothetical protein [Bacteroidales bacterium]
MLPFYQNIPFFCILLSMVGGVITSLICSPRWALRLHLGILAVCCAANAHLACILFRSGESFTYMLGHYPAPWGNELRAGPLEAMLCALFALVMFLCVLGGLEDIQHDILPKKLPLYYLMLNLLWSSMLVMVYTNDLFTAYVFIEINTIASCAIVMAKDTGHTNMATIRYIIMSQLGSGLFLLALALLYGITGQLLFPSLRQAIGLLDTTGNYALPLTVLTGLMVLGLAIKSALYPFHAWLPGAHGNATTASSAILSGLVLKGYIILLIKILYQVYTLPVAEKSHIFDVLFVLAVIAMVMGSWYAMKENHLKRMIAYSSVAQVGYIFLGIGMGTAAGMTAAIFQVMAHAFTKPLLFVSAGELIRVSGHHKQLYYLRGAAHRAPLAGVGFTVGGLSMIGLPLLGGFVTKLFLAQASLELGWQNLLAFGVLAISSVLNALYYLPVILLIWTHGTPLKEELDSGLRQAPCRSKPMDFDLPLPPSFAVAAVCLMAGVVFLGVFFNPTADLIHQGLALL